MCALVAVSILLTLPKACALVREVKFDESYHEQSLRSVTTQYAKTPPEVINSVFQCARSCAFDTLCTRYEYCSGQPEPCTLFESGSTCTGDLENDINLANCRCFSLSYMRYEDQTCRCPVGYYGDGAQCCQNVIQDCTDGNSMPALSGRKNMISFIKPLSYPGKPFEVLCLFDYGGYTTIQKRDFHSNCTDFNRNWEDYRNGFGSMHTCFWLGLDKLYHVLQNNGANDFRMDIHIRNDQDKYCQTDINQFNMGDEETNYTVKAQSVDIVQDPWCDGMFASLKPNGRPFTTYDHSSGNTDCTVYDGSGWWFADNIECSNSNLNTKTTNGNITIKTNKGLVNIWNSIMHIRS